MIYSDTRRGHFLDEAQIANTEPLDEQHVAARLVVGERSLLTSAVLPTRLITHRLPHGRMAEAYEMIYRREKGMLGVIFQWQGVG